MSNKLKVINDPIHNLIQINFNDNDILLPLIDHPIVQRLRYIKQMGLADLVFPSALHNRFSHSIGTSSVAMKIAAHLKLSTKRIQMIGLSGLLHDIGHGPFSHAFEKVFSEIGGISHEEWTPYFIQEILNDSFIDLYSKHNPTAKLCEEDLINIEQNISLKENHSQSIDIDLISSQLDADRLDYLLRDSHFCGVKYGHYDLDWLISCMTIFIDDSGNEKLAIRIKALEAVEQYLMARRLMNSKIYYHRSIVVMEHILVRLLTLVKDKIQMNYEFPGEISSCPILKFLSLLAKSTKDTKREFMQSSFKYYKILSDFDIYYLIRYICTHSDDFNESPDLLALAKILYYRDIPHCVSIKAEKVNDLKNEIDNLVKNDRINPWEIGLFKEQSIFYNHKVNPIYVSSEGKIEKLEHISEIVKNMSNDTKERHFLYVIESAVNTDIIRKLLTM